MTRSELTKTLGAMAAISSLDKGERDSRGRLLPIRYRVAEKIVASIPEARHLTWEQAVDLGLNR